MPEFKDGAVDRDLAELTPAPGGPHIPESHLPKLKFILFPPLPMLLLLDCLSQQKLPPSPPSQTKDPKPILVRSVPFILIPCPALVGYPCGLLFVSIYLLSLYPQSLERQASLPIDLSSSFFLPIPKIFSTLQP